MSEIKRLKNLLLKEFNLIFDVQELSESKHKQPRLFPPRLVDYSSWLEAGSKDRTYGIFTIMIAVFPH